MSPPEGRDSDSKRHRSRFDTDTSPKRSRRDGKPETERAAGDGNMNDGGHADGDQKYRPRLQDALPLKETSVPDSRKAVSKDSDKKLDGNKQISSDPTEHDERGNAGQVGRNYLRKDSDHGRWRDARDPRNERAIGRRSNRDERDEKSQAKRDEETIWRHDKFSAVADSAPPSRKRPAFSEKKVPVDSAVNGKEFGEPEIKRHYDRPLSGSDRRESRRQSARDWRESSRGGFSPRERYGSSTGSIRGGNYKGRDRYNGRQGYNSGSTQRDRWTHDLFHEANKSPPRKNEEEQQIAKIESLLAS